MKKYLTLFLITLSTLTVLSVGTNNVQAAGKLVGYGAYWIRQWCNSDREIHVF